MRATLRRTTSLHHRHVTKPSLVLAAVVMAMVGYVAYVSLASGVYAQFEAELASLSGGAQLASNAGASGGKLIVFGSGATPTPTPAPTPTPTPAPTPTPNPNCTPNPSVTAGFPNNCTTGVPAGTVLSANSSTTVTGTLNRVKLTGDIAVSGSATITNSEIDGTIQNTGSGTLTLTDDTIIGNSNESFTDVFGQNITALRINVSGGKAGLQCSGNCSTTDSWYHDPLIENAYHYDAIGGNGVDGFIVRHNTISCTNHTNVAGYTGGCSADMGFFGDFAPITNITVDNNLFVSSNDSAGYCVITNASKPGKAYPTGSNLVYTNNVWQKGTNGRCGQFGWVDNWVYGNGNVWTGNKWDDGTALNE